MRSRFPSAVGGPAAARILGAVLVAAALLPAGAEGAGELIRGARVLAPDHVRLHLARPVPNTEPSNFRFAEARAPDVPIPVLAVEVQPGNYLLLTVAAKLEAT
ncbi:MAG TPA: hypothetical protein VID50_06090, partial [Candidatus Eisenbacteria bacterium]